MREHFKLEQNESWVKIKKISTIPYLYLLFYVDHKLVATYYTGNEFYFPKDWFGPGEHRLIVEGYNEFSMPWIAQYSFQNKMVSQMNRELVDLRNRDFRAGDILVASDNVNEFKTGYMGHSAIIVDDDFLIESPGGHPAIRLDSIQQYLDYHPIHAQYRPVSLEMGNAAALYATNYLEKYQENLNNGINKPEFSISINQSMEDPWELIYCSKLIWLSYFHGAGYELDNDFLWFSPEDLYDDLKDNDDFELIYKHPNVNFVINT